MSLPPAKTAPSVGGLPWLGPAFALMRDPYRWWARQYQRLGPVYRLKLPTDREPWIAIAGREANELMARDGHRLFDQAATYPKAREVLGTDMHPSFTEGAVQRHLRRQVAPGFSRQAAGPHLPAMTAWVRDHIDTWAAGQKIRVTEQTARLGLNCISLFATGKPLDADTEAVRRYAIIFTGVIAMGWPLALFRWPWIRRTRDGLDELIARRLAEHRELPPGRARPPDYFDFLLRGTLPNGEPLPERVRVVFGQIPFKNMGVYAGRVMNHVLVQLVQRPEVLEAVQPEIDRVLADDEITLEEIASMDVLRATVKETLRMLPTAVALQRTVAEPFEFGGYQFEVGDHLFTPLSVTHFLPEYFPEPDRFDIERFAPERAEDLQRFVYNPFGVGNHSCVAQGVFEALTMVVVGSILHRWRLTAPYRLKTRIDALPGPVSRHRMRVVERREIAPPVGQRRFSPTQRYSLSAALLDAIDEAPEVILADGERLFSQGDPADRLYFIIDGRLAITRDDPDSDELIHLATLGPGDVVGEIGILHGVPRTANVTAQGRVNLMAVEGELFWRAVVENDITALELGELAMRRHAGALIASRFSQGDVSGVPRLGGGRVDELEIGPDCDLFMRGDPAELFYLLVEGELDEYIETPAGGLRLLRSYRAPDCFGDEGLLEGRPRETLVRAGDSGARMLTISRQAFANMSRNREPRAGTSLVGTSLVSSVLAALDDDDEG
jgi:cytochrome P450/CRP-like cAMP-binding protein